MYTQMPRYASERRCIYSFFLALGYVTITITPCCIHKSHTER